VAADKTRKEERRHVRKGNRKRKGITRKLENLKKKREMKPC
jgi:hypothetical protein